MATRKSRAAIPNPALQPFSRLIGEWKTTGKHPLVPTKTFHGRATFEWMEGGAFIIMRTEMDDRVIPAGIAIFGSDDAEKSYFMIYFDERGVSRKYDVTIQGNTWTWSRNAPGFSQRYTVDIVDNGEKMIGKGEMSKDGVTWEGDLDLIYVRIHA